MRRLLRCYLATVTGQRDFTLPTTVQSYDRFWIRNSLMGVNGHIIGSPQSQRRSTINRNSFYIRYSDESGHCGKSYAEIVWLGTITVEGLLRPTTKSAHLSRRRGEIAGDDVSEWSSVTESESDLENLDEHHIAYIKKWAVYISDHDVTHRQVRFRGDDGFGVIPLTKIDCLVERMKTAAGE